MAGAVVDHELTRRIAVLGEDAVEGAGVGQWHARVAGANVDQGGGIDSGLERIEGGAALVFFGVLPGRCVEQLL